VSLVVTHFTGGHKIESLWTSLFFPPSSVSLCALLCLVFSVEEGCSPESLPFGRLCGMCVCLCGGGGGDMLCIYCKLCSKLLQQGERSYHQLNSHILSANPPFCSDKRPGSDAGYFQGLSVKTTIFIRPKTSVHFFTYLPTVCSFFPIRLFFSSHSPQPHRTHTPNNTLSPAHTLM